MQTVDLNLPEGRLLRSATLAAVRRRILSGWDDLYSQAIARGLRSDVDIRPPSLPASVRLLTESRKTLKGLDHNQLTGVLYLPPAGASGVQLCPYRSKQCERACLGPQGTGGGSGQLALPSAHNAAMWRAALLLGAPALFGALLALEARALARKAARLGYQASVRVNGSSDLPGLAAWLRGHVPESSVVLYDYTKDPAAARAEDGVHRTYSFSGYNLAGALPVLQSGGNVAVVFDRDPRTHENLPESWEGYPVLDGDEHDARYLDAGGHVVGLRFKQAKGRAAALESAGKFVQGR